MKLFLALLCFFGVSSGAFAEFMPKSFSALFEQEYSSLLSGKSKKSNGSIDYKYPGNIRLETADPSLVIFVSNGMKSWYYRAPFIEGEDGEVTESSAKESRNVFTKFFDSLRVGLQSNALYDFKSAGDGMHVVSFKPKMAKDLGVKEAILTFSNPKDRNFSDLKKIDLQYPDGKKTTLTLVNIKVNPDFKEERFNFVIPPKTRRSN